MEDSLVYQAFKKQIQFIKHIIGLLLCQVLVGVFNGVCDEGTWSYLYADSTPPNSPEPRCYELTQMQNQISHQPGSESVLLALCADEAPAIKSS